MSKILVALMFGGQSPEHDISIRSARNIFAAIDKEKYEILLIGINKKGEWFEVSSDFFDSENTDIEQFGEALAIVPGRKESQIRYLQKPDQSLPSIDVVFPVLHGPYGEDGSLQGILKHLNLAFVGPDVLGSAVSMDKDVCKRLLREADLLIAEFLCFHYFEKNAIDYTAVVNRLGSPLFIKPANMGSSVGVRKAENRQEFEEAVAEAFRYDNKIIVEEALVGRELECAVMGNAILEATQVGEVALTEETDASLYDYESKYLSPVAADIRIPAPNISPAILAKLILVAQNAYRVLGCEGMARIDMFLTETDQVYINEVNTLPGFTSISMYPKLWEAAGTSYGALIHHLLQLAQEKGERERKLEKTL